MSDTLGSLVDKLGICNQKVWVVQDFIYRVSKMTAEDFANLPPAEVHEQICKLAYLNLERNKLITEVDEALDKAVREGRAPIDRRPKLT